MRTLSGLLMLGALGFGMWVLYQISPQVGRTAAVVLGAIFLLALLLEFVRRWKERHWSADSNPQATG